MHSIIYDQPIFGLNDMFHVEWHVPCWWFIQQLTDKLILIGLISWLFYFLLRIHSLLILSKFVYVKVLNFWPLNIVACQKGQDKQNRPRPDCFLIIKEQSDQGLPCLLLFWLAFCEFQPWKPTFYLRTDENSVQNFRTFTIYVYCLNMPECHPGRVPKKFSRAE